MNQMNEEQVRHIEKEMNRLLGQIQRKIPMLLFAQPGVNDLFCDAARQALRFFRQFTDNIVLREYPLSSEQAVKWGVRHSPTLLFDPERYSVRWLGAPMGEEAKIFLEALLLVGSGESGLSGPGAALVERMDQPRTIKVFVSASCPYCPQQALNALKAAIARPDLFSVEIIDIQANAELADSYAAHSVPQTYADDVLIAKGAQPEELFLASLEKMSQQTVFIPESDAEEVENDLVIVGGGPAGLSAGIYAARSGLSAAIVEKGVLGGQVALTPLVENYPGMKQVGGKTLVDIMVTHALEYTTIYPGEEVMAISPGDRIVVQTSRRKFITRSVLLATGANHRHLGVPGEEEFAGRGVSYCSTCDGPMFRNRKVLMIGGGNSAVTEALHLANMGVRVTVVHRRDRFKAQEVLVQQLIDSGIPVLFNTEIKEISGKDGVEAVTAFNNQTGQTSRVATDGVFLAIGYDPAVALARDIGLRLTEDGYVAHDRYRTSVPGIYTAGDVAGGFKQIVTAAGNGSEAALTIFEDLINPYWKQQ